MAMRLCSRLRRRQEGISPIGDGRFVEIDCGGHLVLEVKVRARIKIRRADGIGTGRMVTFGTVPLGSTAGVIVVFRDRKSVVEAAHAACL